MYQAGQQVVYSAHGVCSILGIEDRTVDRKKISYYVLQPIEQLDSRYYVPTHNENALAKMRPLMDKQSLLELLSSGDLCTDNWIPDENHRKQYYRQLISSLDIQAMIRMIHTLRHQKQQLMQAGRKFHQCDDNFLRDAQRLIQKELVLVLGIRADEVEDYMENLMNQKDRVL